MSASATATTIIGACAICAALAGCTVGTSAPAPSSAPTPVRAVLTHAPTKLPVSLGCRTRYFGVNGVIDDVRFRVVTAGSYDGRAIVTFTMPERGITFPTQVVVSVKLSGWHGVPLDDTGASAYPTHCQAKPTH